MKRILLVAALGLISIGAKAQPTTYNVTNHEFCPITVTPVCVGPAPTCKLTALGAPVPIACCGGTGTVLVRASCGAGTVLGFQVCWNSSLCPTTTCTVVGAINNPPCAPDPATLPPCSDCIQPPSTGQVTVFGLSINVN